MSQEKLKDKKNKYPRDVELLVELLDMERNEIRKLVVDQVIPHLMVQENLLKEINTWLDTRNLTLREADSDTTEPPYWRCPNCEDSNHRSIRKCTNCGTAHP